MKISKILSRNDTGQSGGHQDGFHIPKTIVKFLPDLDFSIKNPRIKVIFKDSSHKEWIFNYIYYNNKKFGGTRNERRLTRTAKYIKTFNLKAGDSINLSKKNNNYFISHDKNPRIQSIKSDNNNSKKIILSHKWKVNKL
jgi:hypothetical protein